MSYTPTEWKNGDTVTAEKLNKLENGLAGVGGNNVVIATISESGGTYTCSMPISEMYTAVTGGAMLFLKEEGYSQDTLYACTFASNNRVSFSQIFGEITSGSISSCMLTTIEGNREGNADVWSYAYRYLQLQAN